MTEAEVTALLSGGVSVEEKLDGANVMLWLDGVGRLEAATRGGLGAIDRAGQLGPLRAWAAARSTALRELLAGGMVLYAEWLWLEHAVRYDQLPDWLFGLDILDCQGEWLRPSLRDEILRSAGLMPPPRIFRGRLSDTSAVGELLGGSRLTRAEAEGIIVRPLDPSIGQPRLAKLLQPAFRPRADAEWKHPLERNRLKI